jgi:hypothetical protein
MRQALDNSPLRSVVAVAGVLNVDPVGERVSA